MTTTSHINRNILRACLVVGLTNLLPKAALVGRELTIANRFGASDEIDAYVLALLLPMLLMQIAINAFSNALMPVYVSKREEQGIVAAGNLAARALFFGFAFLGGLTVLLWLGKPMIIPLMAQAFPAAKQLLTGDFFVLLAPLVFLQGASALWSGLLNAEKRFVAVSLLPVVTPSLVIAVLFSPLREFGMHGVACAMLAGSLIEAGTAALLARRLGLPWPHWGSFDPALKQVLWRSTPLLGSMVLSNCNLFIDQFCATLIGSGSNAMLSYGNKTVAMILSITALPISVSVLPYFADLAAQKNWNTLRQSVRFWGLMILGISIPGTAALFVLSSFITHVLFPAFPQDTHLSVTLIQQYYLLQLPFYLLHVLGTQTLVALGVIRKIFYVAVFSFVVNLVLDILLPPILGLSGIALSTSVMYVGSSCLIFISLFHYLKLFIQDKTRVTAE